MPQLISQRYAQALFDLCEENHKTDIVKKDLEKLLGLIESSSELKFLFNEPTLSSKDRISILIQVFKKNLNETTFVYLLFIEEKRRLNLIQSICKAFKELFLYKQKMLQVKITSSVKLDKKEIQIICDKLQPKFQKEIHPQMAIQSEVLGGLKIQIDDKVFDYTLRGQLERFQKIL